MVDYDGGAGADYRIEGQYHGGQLRGGAHRRDRVVGIMGQHHGIDGSRHLKQEHFNKKGHKNLWQGHRTVQGLENRQRSVIRKKFRPKGFHDNSFPLPHSCGRMTAVPF